MNSTSPETSFWFNRFQAFAPARAGAHAALPASGAHEHWQFRDWLFPPRREVAASRFAGLSGTTLARAFFHYGFSPGAISSFGSAVHERPQHASDVLFWQFPCRTEGQAWERHADMPHPALLGESLHVYVGLPWATWIDCARKQGFGAQGELLMQHQLQTLTLRMSGLRHALAGLGLQLRVHSVCQHICWRDLLPVWQAAGISDIWLAHCPEHGAGLLAGSSLTLHPWALFAVNVQDAARSEGIVAGIDPAQKPVLASFVGAHAPGYLSDVRLRLQAFAQEPGFVVRVIDKWHFEEVVYRHQMARTALADSYVIDESVASYNRLLSDSVFSLCPSGTGPNTLRLWESLAVGSIPVLLGPRAALPAGGTLDAIDWQAAVLQVEDADLPHLPALLRAMPLAERRQRQQAGMAAFAKVSRQRCFAEPA